jgi:hypothetical protein
MISKNRTIFILLSVSIVLCLAGCSSDRYTPRTNTDDTSWVKDHQEIHAEFHYLPDVGKASVSIRSDSVIVEQRTMKDSLLSTFRYVLTRNDYSTLDSLLFYLNHVVPGEYVQHRVIDGTKMWITYGKSNITCDNCLHDYVLAASGLKLAKPSKKLYNLKEAVGMLSSLMNKAQGPGKDKWKRMEVITNIRQLTDTTQKYKVHKDSAL